MLIQRSSDCSNILIGDWWRLLKYQLVFPVLHSLNLHKPKNRHTTVPSTSLFTYQLFVSILVLVKSTVYIFNDILLQQFCQNNLQHLHCTRQGNLSLVWLLELQVNLYIYKKKKLQSGQIKTANMQGVTLLVTSRVLTQLQCSKPWAFFVLQAIGLLFSYPLHIESNCAHVTWTKRRNGDF